MITHSHPRAFSAFTNRASGRRSPAAFTLIELLVVIAIIAILAAILFPVFAKAREKARQTACLSNTKQMAIGIMQYTQDYDELLPVIGDNGACRGRWQFQLYPYVKNSDVFTCPNIPGNKWLPTLTNFSCPGMSLGQADISGFGWSAALAYDTRTITNSNLAPGWSVTEIVKPAETLIIGDVSYEGEAGYFMQAKNPAFTTSGGSAWYYPQFRHNVAASKNYVGAAGKAGQTVWPMPTQGWANFVFLDGHAKSLNVETAFKEAPKDASGNYVEDGTILDPTAAPNEINNYRSHYLLWNIY